MSHKFGQDLIRRYENNPIITREHITVYYGAADTCICMGTAQLGDLMQFCAIDKQM